MGASQEFERIWISFGLPGIREVPTTYGGSNFEALPKLPPIPSNFSWLPPLPEELADCGMNDGNSLTLPDGILARLSSLRATAPQSVPDSFWTLLGQPELQARIPSCTACYFDLPDKWMESPFRDGDHIIRFLNDQQCCYCWHLYVPFDEPPFVFASSGIASEDSGMDTPFLEDIRFNGKRWLIEDVRASCFYVSPDFDSFVYRFWIENMIWFKLTEEIALAKHELNYLRQIDPMFTQS